MDKPVLRLSNLSKRFGELEILTRIDLEVKEGETLAVIGPSGAGKSTLLHIAGLMDHPSDGEMILQGQNIANMSESDRARARLDSIGFVFQFHYLLPDFDVLENTVIPARLAGDPIREAQAAAVEILDRLGLSDRLHHRPYQLSGGEQQRAALARAILRRPKLLLCDEPTGNLDPHTAQSVMEIIWTEIQNHNLSALLVTHNEKISAQADRTFQLADGALIQK